MTEPSHAVFLSYASEDAKAAQRICDALRRARLAVRLERDLELNLAGVALAVELLEELAQLRRELRAKR